MSQKWQTVFKQLAWEQIKIKFFTSIKKRKQLLCAPELRNSILRFYNLDGISRQSPHAYDKSKILNEHGETKLCIKDNRLCQLWKHTLSGNQKTQN